MDTTATDSFRHDNSATTPPACHGSATAGNAVRGRLNAAISRTSSTYGHLLPGQRKRRLFASLPPALAQIGPGTGANLRYYRPGTRLTAIEPNRHMHSPLRKAAQRHGTEPELRDERADATGLPDASVDAVVSALAMGLVTEVVAPGEHVTRALEIAERIASFPQATLLADRWGLLEGLDQRMEFTVQRDVRTLKEVVGDAEQASARFTSGGRGG